MIRRFRRFACVDWSGAAGAFQPGIAVALCEADGPPVLIEPAARHWARKDVLRWLTAQEDMLVGIDFSASLPHADSGAFFPGWSESPADARALWALVERLAADADPHLGAARVVDHDELARYFRRPGGRTGDRFGIGAGSNGRLRITERHARTTGLAPASAFNLVGASQVGKASLSGMRLLHRLSGRIAVWPFDPLPAEGSALVEIYTTIAARAGGVAGGRSKLRDAASLDAALEQLGSPPHKPLPRYDDHRTDALIGAAWLRRMAPDAGLWHPEALTPAIAATEGWTFGIS